MEELRQRWRDAGYYTGTTLADEIGAPRNGSRPVTPCGSARKS